jgi:hypothetical protein
MNKLFIVALLGFAVAGAIMPASADFDFNINVSPLVIVQNSINIGGILQNQIVVAPLYPNIGNLQLDMTQFAYLDQSAYQGIGWPLN